MCVWTKSLLSVWCTLWQDKQKHFARTSVPLLLRKVWRHTEFRALPKQGKRSTVTITYNGKPFIQRQRMDVRTPIIEIVISTVPCSLQTYLGHDKCSPQSVKTCAQIHRRKALVTSTSHAQVITVLTGDRTREWTPTRDVVDARLRINNIPYQWNEQKLSAC